VARLEAQRLLQARLWRFIAAEWQMLVPSVSCGCEMVFEEEIFLLTLPLRKLKAMERKHKLWTDSILN
jgi:hypothetical protein